MADRFAYVGCRTNAQRKAKGRGVSVYRMPAEGAWELLETLETPDPSFLATDSRARWLYAVEGDGETISAFARTADGRLTPLSRTPVHGRNPVHVVVSPNDRFAVVCNHLTVDGFVSNIAAFPIAEDGYLGEPSAVLPVTGEIGVNRKEQPFAKPHHAQFSPDGAVIAVADKGLDEVQFFSLDDAGELTWLSDLTVRLPWGAGPRHLAFHPVLPRLYVLNELDSTVVVIALNAPGERPKAVQRLSSQSYRYSLIHRAAEIGLSRDGRQLYVSNRGQDTIGVFAIDPASGALSPVGWTDSGGKVPRHFALTPEGDRIFVANEFSHDIMEFALDQNGGLTTSVKVADTGSPTCILLA